MTRYAGHATELAEAAAQDAFDAVVGVGGDGTLHEIANGLMCVANPPPLAAVPAGSGNDFVRNLQLPTRADEAVDLVWNGTVERMDVLRCGDRHVLIAAGVGLDARAAAIARRVPRRLRVGTLPYVLGALFALARSRTYALRVSIDGYRTEQPRLMVVVANGQCYAGGMQICPGALMTDGLLDVCLVSDVPRHALIGLLRQVFNGGHVGHPSVRLMRAHHVSIEGPPDCPVHLDGELVGNLPLELEVAERRLPVLVPAAGVQLAA